MKIREKLGYGVMGLGLIAFWFIDAFVTVHPEESFGRDIFGFPIPQMDLPLSLFSLHGLSCLGVAFIFLFIGTIIHGGDFKK